MQPDVSVKAASTSSPVSPVRILTMSVLSFTLFKVFLLKRSSALSPVALVNSLAQAGIVAKSTAYGILAYGGNVFLCVNFKNALFLAVATVSSHGFGLGKFKSGLKLSDS